MEETETHTSHEKTDINNIILNIDKFRRDISKKHIMTYFMKNAVICDNCSDDDHTFYRIEGCDNNMVLCSQCVDLLHENIFDNKNKILIKVLK